MKKISFARIFILLLALYLILFASRAVYDLATFEDTDNNYNVYYESAKADAKLQNIASFRQEYSTQEGVQILDQKYEKISTITSKTIRYDEDEKKLHGTIEECLAVVQMENKAGLTGSRSLSMVIGVKPDHFEIAVEKIKEIGRVTSFTATTTDKTYEYRQMMAEKEKLVRQIESYEAMKERGGNITELLTVEDRIIEVEALLQEQSVMLGDYSDDKALCTINFTMYEGSEASIVRKLWNAFKWSTFTYLAFIVFLLFVCGVAYVLLSVLNYGRRVHDTDTASRKEVENEQGEEK